MRFGDDDPMIDPVFDWDAADRHYEQQRDEQIARSCSICGAGERGVTVCRHCSAVAQGVKP